MAREKAESDVEADPARVDSRDPDGEFVGRVAGADEGYDETTGAERRAEAQADADE